MGGKAVARAEYIYTLRGQAALPQGIKRLLQTTKDPRTTSSFPFSQIPNGCLVDRADENLSGVSSFSPRSKVKLSFDGEVVLTIVCGKGLKLESFSYRKKEIIIVMIPSFDTFFFLQGHKWRYKTTSMRAFENISDGGNRFLTITKWPLPLSATPPFPPPCSIIPRET